MIEKFIKENISDFHDDLKTITLTSAPTFEEHQRVALIKEMLEQLGFQSDIDSIGNLICLVEGVVRQQVVYSAHVDTVFPKETHLDFIEKSGCFYCPGVADNSLSVTSLIYLLKYIKTHNITPHYDTYFLFNVCEEGLGNLIGIKHFIDSTSLPDLIAHFALEGNKVGRLTQTFVGSVRKKVSIKGLGGHSWRDSDHTSAIHVASKMISQLYDIPLPRGSKTTLNVGTIRGGTGVNVIPQYTEIMFEVRFIDQENGQSVLDEASRIIDSYRSKDIQIDVDVIGDRPAGTTKNDEIAERVKNIHQRLGIETEEDIGSSDSNYPASKGLSSFTIGISKAQYLHSIDEFVEIATIEKGLYQLIEIFNNIR
uniref:M20 family metallopeptidase n=1 Tax=Thaumasiovibrio occultus TaxID=1891184 RepID=UPI000B359ED6|nr:M20/M25/M40 family metallo-hydrolase [Thaumasiovibrio occultus]